MDTAFKNELIDLITHVRNTTSTKNLDNAQLSECIFYLTDAVVKLLEESRN